MTTNSSKKFPNLIRSKSTGKTTPKGLVVTAFLAILGVALHRLVRLMGSTFSDASAKAHTSSSALSLIHKTAVTKISYKKIKEGTTERGGQEFVVFAAEDATTHEPISVKHWAELLSSSKFESDALAGDLTNLIQNLPFQGVFFETQGVTSANADKKQFQLCLVDGKTLAVNAELQASPSSFQEHLQDCKEYGCKFSNLGGTATLITPNHKAKDISEPVEYKHYSHLAAFLRGAPQAQVTALWRMVTAEYNHILQTRAPEKPVWLSTAGQGVPWLHFRFDDTPKYYQYGPFADEK